MFAILNTFIYLFSSPKDIKFNALTFICQVYARFVAADHDSGRVSYLVNRRTWLRVTQLVLGLLRVSDTRIATLQGNILQGRAPGRTELQVRF